MARKPSPSVRHAKIVFTTSEVKGAVRRGRNLELSGPGRWPCQRPCRRRSRLMVLMTPTTEQPRSSTSRREERPTSDTALLLTPEEAARRLSVGRTTLYDLLARGELRSVSLGRCRRISVAELEAFVERLDASAVAESAALRDHDIR